MKNYINLILKDNNVIFKYINNKKSVYTWCFNINGNEDEHFLFKTLCNFYCKNYNSDLLVNTKHIKTLKKFRWL